MNRLIKQSSRPLSLLVHRFCTSNNNPNSEKKGLTKIVIGAVGVAISVGAALLANYGQIKEVKNDLDALLPTAIEDSYIEPVSKKNVKRELLDAQLKKASLAFPSDKYYIVYGAKGAGKSHAIDHTFKENKGVVKIMVTTAHNKDDIISEISKELLSDENKKLNSKSLISAVKKSRVAPTIIFDVERGGSNDQVLGLEAVRSLSKMLAPYCRCFIVLSEASAVLQFSKDINRETFIYVDEMSLEEAKEFLIQQKAALSVDQMEKVYEILGGNPAKLKNLSGLTNFGLSVEDFVKSSLLTAEMELVAFPHKAILQALKEHPEGVSPKFFNNRKSEGVDLSDPYAVNSSIKTSNVLVYRMELKLYQLQSTAQKTALKTYDPIIYSPNPPSFPPL